MLSQTPGEHWLWPDRPCRARPPFHLLVPLFIRSVDQTSPSAYMCQTCQEELPALGGALGQEVKRAFL